MIELPLTRGHVALIDDEDAAFVSGLKFCASEADGTVYAVNGSVGPLHRFLLSAPPDRLVDHRDGNGLNNRRHNLRLCSRSQNAMNRRKSVGKSSRFLGVSYSARYGKWRATIAGGEPDAKGERRHIQIGIFADEETAARAYDVAAAICFGEFARLNLPELPLDLELLKRRLSGEIEALASGKHRLRVNGRTIGTFGRRETAEQARLALPQNTDAERLSAYAGKRCDAEWSGLDARLATFASIRRRL